MNPKIFPIFKVVALALLSILAVIEIQAQNTPFTSEDALNIKSFRVSEITKNGDFLAGTISSSKDRLNVDHSRFGDPNYVSPRGSDVVILDVAKEEFIPITGEKVILRGMKWSPDNQTLALVLYKEEAFRLFLYDLKKSKLKELSLKTEKDLASNTLIEWTPDGENIIMSFREEGWKEKADSMYREATVGPVTVYDSKRPFLKWDEIRNFSSKSLLAKVNIQSGKVSELLPEGSYSNIQLTKAGSSLIYQENFSLKTVYNREPGSESSLMMIDWNDQSKQDTLIKKSKKRIRTNWNKERDHFAYADSGKIFVRSIYEDEGIKVSQDTTEIIKKDTSKVKFSIVRWSPDGNFVVASSKKGYWMLDIKNKTQEMVYEFPEDKEKAPSISISEWSPDGKFWYMSYSANDKWERGLMLYDLDSKTMKELVKDENLYSGWNLTEDGSRLFYNFSDGDHPAELFVTNPEFSSSKQLTDFNPWIKNKKLTRSELVKYMDSDGKELYGILYYPVDYEPGK